MSCEHDWTIRFPNVEGQGDNFEIRPYTFDFRWGRSEFAYVKAKLDREVGKSMKPHTRYSRGELREETIVQLCYEDEPVHTLYFDPSFADYGDDYTHIQFEDLQKSMDTGVIDKKWSSVTLREAYNHVFSKKVDKGLIKDIKFTIPEEVEHELIGEGNLESDGGGLFGTDFTVRELEGIAGTYNRYMFPRKVQAIEANDTKRLVDSYHAIEFDKVSPQKAILKLNKKFGVISWVDKNRILWIGSPESKMNVHVAAPDDPRVWRYNSDEVNIRHPGEPVRQVTVEGGWVDEPGYGGFGDAVDEVASWFDGENDKGAADYLAHGVAYRTDIDHGDALAFSAPDAKRDALPHMAKVKMRELMKQDHSGQVEINPNLSGDFTSPAHVKPGDLVHLVPDDSHFDQPSSNSGQVGEEPEELDGCKSFVNNEVYFVKEVEHHLDDNGYWSLTLDVGMFPDILYHPNEDNPDKRNMEATTRYFDPSSNEYLKEDDVYDGDWIEETSFGS